MMLTASPSPRHDASPHLSSSSSLSPCARYDHVGRPSISSSPIVKPHSSHVDAAAAPPQPTTGSQAISIPVPISIPIPIPPPPRSWSSNSFSGTSRPSMVDAATQYSPPPGYTYSPPPRKLTISEIGQLNLVDSTSSTPHANTDGQEYVPHSQPQPQVNWQPHPPLTSADAPAVAAAAMPTGSPLLAQPHQEQLDPHVAVAKRQNSSSAVPTLTDTRVPEPQRNTSLDQGPAKRARAESQPAKVMPLAYETCDTKELVILISSMLMELIRYNDAIPLRDGALTRFHSRAPPGISVLDYLQRLTTHATLSPPILLSMVYYIDKLCALYPAFTISSLTVHRFLITSATVASKGLSDSFWTNKTYARVGGVSIKELATLELEFLGRVQWRIVPRPEVLIDYYRSLVERSPGYALEEEDAP